jgi:hypothetical protein
MSGMMAVAAATSQQMRRTRGVTDPFDDSATAECPQGETGEIGAEHKAEALKLSLPSPDEGAEEAVGELNDARGDDERPGLCAENWLKG